MLGVGFAQRGGAAGPQGPHQRIDRRRRGAVGKMTPDGVLVMVLQFASGDAGARALRVPQLSGGDEGVIAHKKFAQYLRLRFPCRSRARARYSRIAGQLVPRRWLSSRHHSRRWRQYSFRSFATTRRTGFSFSPMAASRHTCKAFQGCVVDPAAATDELRLDLAGVDQLIKSGNADRQDLGRLLGRDRERFDLGLGVVVGHRAPSFELVRNQLVALYAARTKACVPSLPACVPFQMARMAYLAPASSASLNSRFKLRSEAPRIFG